jgi:hypothetical protein
MRTTHPTTRAAHPFFKLGAYPFNVFVCTQGPICGGRLRFVERCCKSATVQVGRRRRVKTVKALARGFVSVGYGDPQSALRVTDHGGGKRRAGMVALIVPALRGRVSRNDMLDYWEGQARESSRSTRRRRAVGRVERG